MSDIELEPLSLGYPLSGQDSSGQDSSGQDSSGQDSSGQGRQTRTHVDRPRHASGLNQNESDLLVS
jgi:hypothetical protein